MLKCKVCGTANSPDSSVCAKCGAKLRVNRKAGTKKRRSKDHSDPKKNKAPEDIFSTSKHMENENPSEPIKDVFSSEEAYEKARKGSVLEKIHELEEEIGDTSESIEELEQPKIVPMVINRTTSNDIIRSSKPQRDPKDKKHDIPHRVIRSVKVPAAPKKADAEEQEETAAAEELAAEKSFEQAEVPAEKTAKEPELVKDEQPKKNGSKRNRKKKPKLSPIKEASSDSVNGVSESGAEGVESVESPKDDNDIVSDASAQADLKKEKKAVETVAAMSALPKAAHKSVKIEKTEEAEQVSGGKPEKASDEIAGSAFENTVSEEKTEEAPKADAAPEQSLAAEVETIANSIEGEVELPSDEPSPVSQTEVEKSEKGEESAPEEIAIEVKPSEKSPEESGSEPKIRQREIPHVAERLKKEKKRNVKEAGDKASEESDEPAVEAAKPKVKKRKKPASGEGAEKAGETSGEAKQKVRKKKKPVSGEAAATAGETSGEAKPKAKKKPAHTSVKTRPADTPVKKREIPNVASKKISFDKADVEENRYLAALSYLGVLIVLPLFKRRDSEFCRAHVKQGAAVLLWTLAISLVTLAAVLGLRALILWVLGLSVIVYDVLALAVTAVMLTLIFIPVFEGAVGAFSGMYKQVPFVGKFVKR